MGNSLLPEKLKQLGFKESGKTMNDPIFVPKDNNALCYVRYPGTEYKSLIFQREFSPGVKSDLFKFTKDNIITSQLAVTFYKDSIFLKLFRDEFEKLFESGILNTVEKYHNNKEYRDQLKIIDEDLELKVLTLEDLQSGFVIWIVTVLISVIVFIFEKIFHKIAHKQEDVKIVNSKKQKKKKKRPKTKFINVKSLNNVEK